MSLSRFSWIVCTIFTDVYKFQSNQESRQSFYCHHHCQVRHINKALKQNAYCALTVDEHDIVYLSGHLTTLTAVHTEMAKLIVVSVPESSSWEVCTVKLIIKVSGMMFISGHQRWAAEIMNWVFNDSPFHINSTFIYPKSFKGSVSLIKKSKRLTTIALGKIMLVRLNSSQNNLRIFHFFPHKKAELKQFRCLCGEHFKKYL